MSYYLYSDEIETNIIEKLNYILNKYSKKCGGWLNDFYYHIDILVNSLEYLEYEKDFINKFTDLSYNILSKYYPISKNCKLFELWKYEIDNNTIKPPLAIHTDNDNGDNIHTIIIYTKKDNTVKGGNLLIYDYEKLIDIIDTKQGTVICMNGDTRHCPENMSGKGIRSCAVLQFSKLDN
jgi:hypothetical protein